MKSTAGVTASPGAAGNGRAGGGTENRNRHGLLSCLMQTGHLPYLSPFKDLGGL